MNQEAMTTNEHQQGPIERTCPAKALSAAVRAEAFPAHPRFPQLKTVSNPKLMLDLFREHLKPVAGKSVAIEECVPVRFRWKSDGSRCILQYALRLLHSDHRSPNEHQTSDVWVTSVLYAEKGEAENAWSALRAGGSNVAGDLLIFEPVTLIGRFQMVVHAFPFDRLIHSLPSTLRGPWPELQQRLLPCFGPDCWEIERQLVEPLRYLHEQGAVLRYTVHARSAAERQTKRFYAKVYRTRHGEQVNKLLQQIHHNLNGATAKFTVVEPLFYCSERRCLVLAEAPGRSLQEILSDSEEGIDSVRPVARALAAFNQSEVPALASHSAQEQLGFLQRAAELLRWARPASTAFIDDVVNEASARLRDVPHAPIHWDLKSDHIFLDGEQVIFIDLDTVSLGDPARDPAHLAAHIACRIDFPEINPDRARAAALTLVEEYFAHVPASWREQFTLQYAIAALEAACGLFKRQEPDWADRATSAIREARAALAGRC
ncbi:MAG TPA: phosphotransferase [Verrucomicrobiae bacterium]|nr:phosphotransferase [Verrucomicrobiae bacterium]